MSGPIQKLRPKSAKSAFDIDMNKSVSQDAMITRFLEDHFVKKEDIKKTNVVIPSHQNQLKSPYASKINLRHCASSVQYSPHPPVRKKRPVSAPAYRLGTGSWTSFDDLNRSGSCYTAASSTCGSWSSKYSNKPIYRRKHYILCVKAYLNGSRKVSVRATANDLKQLLVECTTKLALPSAGRKLYLEDGTLVEDQCQLSKNVEVYVSTGEAFKDPFENMHEREAVSKSSFWTLNGIVTPVNQVRARKMRSSLSVRMMELVDSQKHRILVFRNGESLEGVEVVGNRFDEFLDDCTDRLKLLSHAKSLFDWNGSVVTNFSQVPLLHKVLQPTSGMVMGPIWVTRGESFSPKGAYQFLKTMVSNTKERIQSQEKYLDELESQLDIDGVMISNPDVEEELEEESITLNELREAFTTLNESYKAMKKANTEEENMTESAYRCKNITEIDANSRLLTTNGVKVRLFANGSKSMENTVRVYLNLTYLTKAMKSKEQGMERFFDYLNGKENVKELFGFQSSNVFIKRAFFTEGTEIHDLNMMSADAEIWLSLGENFIPIQCHIITLNIEKVKQVNLWGHKQIIQKDIWMGCDQNQTKSKLWLPVASLPLSCDSHEMKVDMSNDQKILYLKQSNETRLPHQSTFLQSKQDHCLVLHPEVSVYTKSLLQYESDVWGENVQKWTITKDGLITNRHFKSLLLGVCDQPLQMLLNDNGEDEILDGAVVSCHVKSYDVTTWVFTPGGYIQPANNPGYVLTAVKGFDVSTKITSNSMEEEDAPLPMYNINDKQRNGLMVIEYNESESDVEQSEYNNSREEIPVIKLNENPFEMVEDVYGGQKISLCIFPKFPSKHPLAPRQRWAVKTNEGNDNQSFNSTWIQQKLCWPTDERGNFIQDMLEGQLCFDAPKLKWRKLRNSKDEVFKVAMTEQPIKLQVLINGDNDTSHAAHVVAPNVKHLKKDVTGQLGANGEHKRMSPDELEFFQFLQKCTDALSLPFAARRLFDTEGKEHFSLSDFEKNDVVYISCGETWNDPSLSHAEQQKRLLLANLASDVSKMKHYVALKQQHGFIVRCGNKLEAGSKLFVCYEGDIVGNKLDDEIVQDLEEIVAEEEMQDEMYTAHQRSHAKFDNNIKNDQEDFVEVKQERDTTVTHREALFGSQAGRTLVSSSYHWVFQDGFIRLKTNVNLVLAVYTTEGSSHNEVILCRKKVEQSNQRWIMSRDGTICLKSNPQLVLTVAPPPIKPSEHIELHHDESIYLYSRVIVAPRRVMMNGNSNQVFWWDEESSLIHCFATDDINKELTAANKSLVCTYAVFGKHQLCQPGYLWQRKEADGTKTTLHFCESCGKSMRGKVKLESITQNNMLEFACAMGEAKKFHIKLPGSFPCVGSKVDLSAREFEATVELWDRQLQRLRDEASVRVITSEIMALQNNPAVRLLVHRNGERAHEGVLVIGSSLSQILDNCTMKLNLPKAARRLYTMDGELITNMQHLLLPYYPELTYLKEIQSQIKSSNGDKEENEEAAANMKIEKLDVRIPVDVWVSMGEAFVPLDEVEKEDVLKRFEQFEKFDTSKNLQLQKHRLRQAKAQRISKLNSGVAIKPIVMKAWKSQTEKEAQLERSIHSLKNQLTEVKLHQETRASEMKLKRRTSLSDKNDMKQRERMKNKRIYQLPQAVKVFVFANGESSDKNEVVFAGNMTELLDNATNKLMLTSCARRLFTKDGKEITDINQLQRHQVICVSCGEKFVAYRDRRNKIELKATWSRVNRQLMQEDNKWTRDEQDGSSQSSTVNSPYHTSSKIAVTKVTYTDKALVLSKRPKSAKVGWL